MARGVAAADPSVLPTGTVIHVDRLQPPYNGTYTVLDTGGKIRGMRIDLFMPDCAEAVRFGRREAIVDVVHAPVKR